jgi:hypothetical protein
MTLLQNPVFLTQKRLVHRAGAVAAVFGASLIGLGLFLDLVVHVLNPAAFGLRSAQAAGRTHYGWTLAPEFLALVPLAFGRISGALAEDRRAGLWDSNRLTLLKPPQLVAGYWFGAALREFYMASALVLAGLAIILLGEMPVLLWTQTQTLLAGGALFFGILAVLAGMAFGNAWTGILMLAAFVIADAMPPFQAWPVVTHCLLAQCGLAAALFLLCRRSPKVE